MFTLPWRYTITGLVLLLFTTLFEVEGEGDNIAISCHKLSIASYTDISIDAKEPQETLESQDEPMSVDSETRDQNRPPDGQDSETKMDEELAESTKGQDGKSSCASCTI